MDQNGNMQNMLFQQGMGGGFNQGMMDQQQMNPMMNQFNMANPQGMMNQQNMMNQMMGQQNMMNQPNMTNQMMNQMMLQNQMNQAMALQNMMNQMMGQQNMMNQPNMMNQMMLQNQMNQQNMNMMNQANMINQSMNQVLNQQQNNANSFQTQDANNISVGFRLQIGEGPPKPPVIIQCTLNDLVGSIIQSYRNKTGDNDAEHEKFIFNAKRLNETLTVAEAGINNNSVIFVLNDRNVDGGV